jgi:hypothetical protein
MKKINADEANALLVSGTGRSSVFYRAICGLKPGEALVINKSEYTLKYGVGQMCKLISKRFKNVKYRHGKLADGSGWLVQRLE